jgi:hypothetical protein
MSGRRVGHVRDGDHMTTWKHDGFISYSTRADSLLADRIQDGLERLAKPWNRRRALKIFQDVDDLAASSDLAASLRSELEGSNTLVFLASPESAASPWCGDELAYWIAERPPEQLVVVLTDGELVFDKDASPPIDFERSTAAPPAFAALSAVPLYVDMRDIREADELDHRTDPEFRARLTKVAAALHSNKSGQVVEPRDIDSLDAREHRRTRRVRNSAIAALALLTVAAVIASIVAFLNQQEADAQRAEAELQAANALARVALIEADADLAGALATAAQARGFAANDITDTALHQLLWRSRPLTWTVRTNALVTGAVPAGDLTAVGTEEGEVLVVDEDGGVTSVVEPTGVAVVDITADPDGELVAVAWADGRAALVDVAAGRSILDAVVEGVPTAAMPDPAGGPALVVATATGTTIVDQSGARSVGVGVPDGRRARVLQGVMTYADNVAVETDLGDGSSFSFDTGANRAVFHDAAAGMAMVADDRTPEVNIRPFGSVAESEPDDVPPSWWFDRRTVPRDDVVLSGDGLHAAVLSGSSLEVFASTRFEGTAERTLSVLGVDGSDEGHRRVETDHAATVAVTVTGDTVQRWEIGRDVASPEDPPLGANDAFIALRVTDATVEWLIPSGIDGVRSGRLDLTTGTTTFVPGEAFTVDQPDALFTEPDTERRQSSDGAMSARIRSGVVTVWDEPSGDVRFRIDPFADSGYLTFTPDGRHLVLASRGGGMEYWPLHLDDICPELDRRVGPGTAAAAGCGAE